MNRVFRAVPAVSMSSGLHHMATKTIRAMKAASPTPNPAARTAKQATYIKLLQSDAEEGPHIIIASGSAGSGKTALATHVGIQKLKSNKVKRLVITRPAICVDEEHGFLPGTLDQKMEPWLRPIFDVLHMHYSPEHVKQLMSNKIIELCPLAFMRGRTFANSWIICDEAQNCTPNQMLMVMTRIGDASKLVITGDPMQFDRGFEDNGLADIIHRVEQSQYEQATQQQQGIAVIKFDTKDVVRHPIVAKVLAMYGQK